MTPKTWLRCCAALVFVLLLPTTGCKRSGAKPAPHKVRKKKKKRRNFKPASWLKVGKQAAPIALKDDQGKAHTIGKPWKTTLLVFFRGAW